MGECIGYHRAFSMRGGVLAVLAMEKNVMATTPAVPVPSEQQNSVKAPESPSTEPASTAPASTASTGPETRILNDATSGLPAEPSRILIADDEHLVASGLAASLSDLAFEVVGPASDGQKAIELCRAEAPDLALLDIQMPNMDGLTAAEVIFREFGIPVVIFSAYSDSQYVETGNRIGIFGYMLKPVTQDQLRVGISVAWGRYLDHLGQAQEITRLEDRLANRRIIEQAKWIVVKRRNVTEPEAMRLLQQQARRSRKTLVDVSQGLIDNDSLLGEE